jgi:hypothetical protein
MTGVDPTKGSATESKYLSTSSLFPSVAASTGSELHSGLSSEPDLVVVALGGTEISITESKDGFGQSSVDDGRDFWLLLISGVFAVVDLLDGSEVVPKVRPKL